MTSLVLAEHPLVARETAAVTTRPRTPGDATDVRALHDATRVDDFAGWPGPAAEAFLELQHRAREAALPPQHEDLLIEVAGQVVGRLVSAPSGPELSLIILEVLPEFRGRGVGSSALAALCEQADARSQAIELHVLPGNPAIRLYRRHGFQLAGQPGFHLRMTRPAASKHAAAARVQP